MTCQRQGPDIAEDRSYVVVVGSIIETFQQALASACTDNMR